jgi:hypothetical protein
VQLEHVRVVLRPRSTGEALDLGLALLRAWFAPLALTWLLTAVPVLLACLAWFGPWNPWAYVVWWWLAPMLERPLQFVLSRGVFGATPSAREVLRALPRTWSLHLPRGLLLQRLDPTRAVVQPAALLEGVSGRVLARRESLLRSDQWGACLMLMQAALAFELVLAGSTLLGVYYLHPASGEFEDWLGSLVDPNQSMAWVTPLAALLAFSLGSFVRACSGFALYLNRRTEVEGWDLEVALRVLAQRARASAPAQRSTAVASAAWAPLVLLLFTLQAEPAPRSDAAQQAPLPELVSAPAEPPAQVQDPVALADEILDGPEFHRRVKSKQLRLPGTAGRASVPGLGWFGGLFEILLWAALVGALALLVWWIALRTPQVLAGRVGAQAAPTEAFGLDIRPESLPADVAAAAADLWARGDERAALSLLYRGAIARLVDGGGLEIGIGDTEVDCLARVRATSPGPVAQYFAALTRGWTTLAWSREPITPATFSELCAGWRRAFAAGA